MTIPGWVYHMLWHGLRGAAVAFSTGVAVAGVEKAWPTDWQWLLITAGVIVGFFNGAESGNADPK